MTTSGQSAASSGGVFIPVPEDQLRQAFDNSTWYLLSLWPALHVACANNWGGADTSDKRDWFAGAVSDLVCSSPPPPPPSQSAPGSHPSLTHLTGPATTQSTDSATTNSSGSGSAIDVDYLADFLVQVMADEFDCHVEDETELAVAADILALRARLWGERTLAAAREVEARWRNRGQMKGSIAVQDVDQDADSDEEVDEDEDGDEEMGEAPALVPVQPREKVAPEVDEEGFTKVVGKKKR